MIYCWQASTPQMRSTSCGLYAPLESGWPFVTVSPLATRMPAEYGRLYVTVSPSTGFVIVTA